MMSSADILTHHSTDFDYTNTPTTESKSPASYSPEEQIQYSPHFDQQKSTANNSKHSPTATTSRDIGIQSNGEVEKIDHRLNNGKNVEASVVIQPDDISDAKTPCNQSTENANNNGGDKEEEIDDGENRLDNGECGGKDKRERKDEKFRKNGNLDKLDGVWQTKEKKKAQNDKEENSCIVDCLYYTNTCCDCSIM